MNRSLPGARAVLWVLAALSFSAHAARAILVDVDAALNNHVNPVEVLLEAGSYSVTPVGIAGGGAFDAFQPWGNDTTCATPSGCAQTLPTSATGWKISYDVMSDALTAVSVSQTPLASLAVEPDGVGIINDYWIASELERDRYHVDDQTVYPSAADALARAESSSFTLSTSGLVGFALRDGFPDDNLEGMSLEVTRLPESSATLLLGSGSAGVLLCSRTRRRAARGTAL
jgi:hypothetical protein